MFRAWFPVTGNNCRRRSEINGVHWSFSGPARETGFQHHSASVTLSAAPGRQQATPGMPKKIFRHPQGLTISQKQHFSRTVGENDME
jgi:hypothetical protein